MKVWNDHITIWNEGALPLSFTIDTLKRAHESKPRNKLIANAFYLAGLIEAWGRGYEMITSEFAKEGLQSPTFEELRGGMMATIQREKYVEIMGNKTDETKQGSTAPDTAHVGGQKGGQKTDDGGSVTVPVSGTVSGTFSGTATKPILILLNTIKDEALGINELQAKLDIKTKRYIRESMLKPSIEYGYIQRLYIDKPSHPNQKYYLTEKGKQMINNK